MTDGTTTGTVTGTASEGAAGVGSTAWQPMRGVSADDATRAAAICRRLSATADWRDRDPDARILVPAHQQATVCHRTIGVGPGVGAGGLTSGCCIPFTRPRHRPMRLADYDG